MACPLLPTILVLPVKNIRIPSRYPSDNLLHLNVKNLARLQRLVTHTTYFATIIHLAVTILFIIYQNNIDHVISNLGVYAALIFSSPPSNAQLFNDDGTPPNPITITVGSDVNSNPPVVGWTEGVCYTPLTSGVHPGDSLLFEFDGHNVYQMPSKEAFDNCDFVDATLLAQVGESPYTYYIPKSAMGDNLYFACQVGDHCAGGTQKLQVSVTAFWGNAERVSTTPSSFQLGKSVDECKAIQDSEGAISESDQIESSGLQSFCSDPVLVEGEEHTYYRTCLSGPATLTPGGVINRLFVMHDPFPQDYRVVIGQRTFEFVEGDPDSEEGITPVPINQLYVHHLSGSVVFGQGTEGVRQTAPDAPFPEPYGLFSGEDGNTMIFHLIDLREVDDWLSCIECRCPLSDMPAGTYLDELTQTGNITGGVNCCSNCTDIKTDTVDYRMRYNITYRELQEEDAPVTDVRMLTADISPEAGNYVLEHDVFSAEYLPEDQVSPDNPDVQRLEMIKPFNEIFSEEFFQRPYNLSPNVKLLRCVAHLHVAAIDMWLENVETGEKICDGSTTYGIDPESDKDFLTAVEVSNYDPPLEFAENLMVRFVSEYNATNVHTGVMGYFFLFVAGDDEVSSKEVNVTVDLCLHSTCDAALLPVLDISPFQQEVASSEGRELETECIDTLAESPSCTFGGECDCDEFINAKESSGCNGFYSSTWGNIEVRSVCASSCGCDTSAAIEEAVQFTVSQTNAAADEDCVDTLANHPSCTFGGLCDCKTFVESPESTGCGGVYASAMGDVQIDSVCNKYCGCTATSSAAPPTQDEPSPTSGSGDCINALVNNPACRFGGLCDCEELVNSEESEGCGGLYKSEMGDIVIHEVCASYCDACIVKSAEELFNEAYSEVLTLTMQESCRYATQDCQAALSNLYSCAKGAPGIEEVSPMLQSFVINNGEELALENAKLGTPSLHVGKENQTVESCSASAVDQQEITIDLGDVSEVDIEADSAASTHGCMLMFGLFIVSLFFV